MAVLSPSTLKGILVVSNSLFNYAHCYQLTTWGKRGNKKEEDTTHKLTEHIRHVGGGGQNKSPSTNTLLISRTKTGGCFGGAGW